MCNLLCGFFVFRNETLRIHPWLKEGTIEAIYKGYSIDEVALRALEVWPVLILTHLALPL